MPRSSGRLPRGDAVAHVRRRQTAVPLGLAIHSFVESDDKMWGDREDCQLTHIERIEVEHEGFLGGLDVTMSPGLNVLIGARGGKCQGG